MHLDPLFDTVKQQLIFLVGFMGTGKTHWGRIWAQKCGYHFIDLDEAIEEEEGLTVADIFAKKGEGYFRSKEAALLRRMADHRKTIIACGGGAPCFFDNMAWMKEHGTTVLLKAEPEFIINNIKKHIGKRPLLQGMDEMAMRAFISTKLLEREPFYGQAVIILDAATATADSINELGLFKT